MLDAAGRPVSDAAIRLQGASRAYGSGPVVHALRPTDLIIEQGSYSAVVGPSGSGKSTLLNLIGLLDAPTTGEVYIGDTPTASLSAGRRTLLRGRSIGFVFQAFHLLEERTVRANVELGLLYQGARRRERAHRADEVLEAVGLQERQTAFARTLSGGERQRAAIARALASDADVLLCDEPTGNLDQDTGRSILELLRELHGSGKTIVAVTHDPTVAAEAEQVITLVDGAVQS